MGIKDIEKVIANLDKIVAESTNKENLKKLGSEAIKRIKKRTRLGKGVKDSQGPTHKLPDLKSSTVKRRTNLKRQGKLTGLGARPKKSGINQTGETLDSLNETITRDKIKIRLSKEGEKRANNLLKINENYEFMNISKIEFKALVNILSESIEEAIKKLKL